MRIVVFGAGGRVGTRTVAEALERGHEVTAVVRDPEAHDLHGDGLTVVAGDATDPASVAEVAAGHDLAISTVGTGFGKTPETLPAAARALLEGLSRAGVARLIVLGGAGSLEVAPGVRVLDTDDFREEWKPDALAQAEALDIYRSATTDVDWTYVSPAARARARRAHGRVPHRRRPPARRRRGQQRDLDGGLRGRPAGRGRERRPRAPALHRRLWPAASPGGGRRRSARPSRRRRSGGS